MSFTVTATEQGAFTSAGMALVVDVLTGSGTVQAASPATGTGVNTQISVTPAATGSRIYGSLLTTSTALVAGASTTFDNNVNAAGLGYIAERATALTTFGTPVTVGASIATGGLSAALAEVLAFGARDASSPAALAAAAVITQTTAAFNPPPGSTLLVRVATNGGAGVVTMAITDTSGLGLTWVEVSKANASGAGYSGVWMALVPGGAPAVVATVSRGFHPGRGPTRARFWRTPRSADPPLATTALPDAGSAADTLAVTAVVALADAGAALADGYSDAYADVYGTPGDLLAVTPIVQGSVSSQFHPGRGPSSRARFWKTPRSSDIPSAGASAIALPDAGSAAETAAVTAAVPLAEAGTGADALAVAAVAQLADAGTSAEALAVTATAALAEAGSAAEALAVTAAVPLAESGAGTETLATTEAPALGEAGTGADTLAAAAAVPLADAGSGADTITTAAAAALADAGAAAETAAVTAAVPLAESGIGTDALSVSAPGAPALPESGSSAESLTGAAAVPLAEAGSAADALTVLVSVPLADAGAGADTVLVTVAVSLAEIAAAADTLGVSVLDGAVVSAGATGRGFHPGRGPTRARFYATPRSSDIPVAVIYGTAVAGTMTIPAALAGQSAAASARAGHDPVPAASAAAGQMTIAGAQSGQMPLPRAEGGQP